MVPPVRFIPIAETNGLINLLGAWALKAACVQLASSRKSPSASCTSRSTSARASSATTNSSTCWTTPWPCPACRQQLVLEITEGTLMIDPAHAEAILGKMAEREARIAIDDFGTGYSSLAYLKRFPISVLKVDRAFIKDLPDSQKDGAICNAVLDLAAPERLSVVAEGVETEEQLRFLDQRGCHYIQGYLTGKPMPAHVAMAALKENLYAELLPTDNQRNAP
jgi:EAL domain-containing protein (putative c-di-GMP-specific phosphodiesterase class I)